MTTQRFEFVSNGNRLSGFFDVPAGGAAHAMIVIIHGYGKTTSPDARLITDLRSPVHPARNLDVDMGQARLLSIPSASMMKWQLLLPEN